MAWTDKRLEERFNEIDHRFDETDRRFDRIEGQLVELRQGMGCSADHSQPCWRRDHPQPHGRDRHPRQGV
jgi:hypothetical protein